MPKTLEDDPFDSGMKASCSQCDEVHLLDGNGYCATCCDNQIDSAPDIETQRSQWDKCYYQRNKVSILLKQKAYNLAHRKERRARYARRQIKP